jgi:hypothetical protein
MNEIESKARESKQVYVGKTFGDNDFDKISFNETLNSVANLKPYKFYIDDLDDGDSFELVENSINDYVDGTLDTNTLINLNITSLAQVLVSDFDYPPAYSSANLPGGLTISQEILTGNFSSAGSRNFYNFS